MWHGGALAVLPRANEGDAASSSSFAGGGGVGNAATGSLVHAPSRTNLAAPQLLRTLSLIDLLKHFFAASSRPLSAHQEASRANVGRSTASSASTPRVVCSTAPPIAPGDREAPGATASLAPSGRSLAASPSPWWCVPLEQRSLCHGLSFCRRARARAPRSNPQSSTDPLHLAHQR